MDPKLAHAASKRLSSLFSGRNSGNRNSGREQQQTQTIDDTKTNNKFADKNAYREIRRLAKNMELDVVTLKKLLGQQKEKLKQDDPKLEYMNWLLKESGTKTNNNNSSEKKKMSPRSDSMDAQTEILPKKRQKIVSDDEDEKMEENTSTDDDKVIDESSAIQDPKLLSDVKFSDHANLHPSSKKAIEQILKLQYMTEIQAKTFDAASSGKDVLGRARTGTGKTMAFLLPALERLLQNKEYRNDGSSIGILIISPTRELATQIGDQASKLLTFHDRNMKVQVVFGGTKIDKDIRRMKQGLPTILVATPGRLLDHLENTKIGRLQLGNDVMVKTPVLILDETDRLLDMGFRREIAKILKFLPSKERRQTLLFSATVPQELKQIMAENMRKDYIEVDCIGDGGASSSHTNDQVDQSHVILPSMKGFVNSVVQIVTHYMNSKERSKIVVFFPTARLVGFFAEFFTLGLNIDVIELHSRKSQSYRNKASDKFRSSKTGVLFTSDVSARGVDYPDVTNVIQFGLPDNREQYIHRLGRTGRAGKAGKGLLVLAPFERKFISSGLKGMDIPVDPEINSLINKEVDSNLLHSITNVLNRINSNNDEKLVLSAKQAYQAFLGYYNGKMKQTTFGSKDELVATANNVASLMGLSQTPGLLKRTIGKMGLQGVRGLVIEKPGQQESRGGNNSRGRPGRNNGSNGGGRRR